MSARIRARQMSALLMMGIVMSVSSLNSTVAAGERIVFLGDSITQAGAGPKGYVSLCRESIKASHPDADLEIIGAGISGNRVPDLQARLERDVLDKNPTLVVVYIGINDVWHSQQNRGTSKDDYRSGLQDIIARIQAKGARVILCTPSVIGEKTDGSNPLDGMLDEYSEISRSVASATKSQLLDLRKAFVEQLAAAIPIKRRRAS